MQAEDINNRFTYHAPKGNRGDSRQDIRGVSQFGTARMPREVVGDHPFRGSRNVV